MPVPKFFEFFGVFLETLKDGETHSAKEVRETIARKMNLSEADISDMLPSGRHYFNRVSWAKTYLQRAGFVETPQRGNYRITAEGKKALKSGARIDLEYLANYDTFKDFRSILPENDSESSHEEKNESHVEILEAAYEQINSAPASQLMDEVMRLSSAGFERLVVKLLLSMGYGNGINDAGKVTRLSNDEGIDGITLTRLMIKHNSGGLESDSAQKFSPHESESQGVIFFVNTAAASTGLVLSAQK